MGCVIRMTHEYFCKFPFHENSVLPFPVLGVSVSTEGREIVVYMLHVKCLQ